MKKTINGIEYESTPELQKRDNRCFGCCADDDGELCICLGQCDSTEIIWKEVKDDSASKDV